MLYTVTPATPMKTSAHYGGSWVVMMDYGTASRTISVTPSIAQAIKWMNAGCEPRLYDDPM